MSDNSLDEQPPTAPPTAGGGTDGPEPYREPRPDAGQWPEWTPHQRQNWQAHGAPIYERLDTEPGSYWFRRTWRPKKRKAGLMRREHVKLTTPEYYLAEQVMDHLGDETGNQLVVMRGIGTYGVDSSQLRLAIEDNVQARVAATPPDERQLYPDKALSIATRYGVDADDDVDVGPDESGPNNS